MDKKRLTTHPGKVVYCCRNTDLPTETEWEYAALALSEVSDENLYRGKKKFPWDGEYTRSGKRKNQGDQLGKF